MNHHRGDESPPSSFAQTGPEFTPDDDDDETYELAGAIPDDEEEPYTPEEELAVRTKFDRKLVLFLALLYMLSFLDRSNIGNARIAGMDEDLQTDPPREGWYQWALTAFYLSYIGCEWMTLLWRVVPAHVLVALVVMTWGLAASLQAVAASYPMLIALRVVLGAGEAGFTGIPYYLSFFYKRRELAFRVAMFVSAAPLATSFASTLAWAIVKTARYSPVAPWRMLFLVEGFPSVVAATIAWGAIPDSPRSAAYLTPRERQVAVLRLQHPDDPSPPPSSSSSSGSTMRDLLAVVADPVSWFIPGIFFLANMAYSSLPVFLPKMVSDMGYGPLSSQALCAPPYLLAFLLVLFTAHMSDRLAARTVPIVFHALASAFGYALLALAPALRLPPWLRYLAVYPAAIGFFNVVVLVIAWNMNNQASEGRRGGAFALMQIVGQCGPLVGTSLYPDGDAPYFVPGMSACALAMLGVAGLALVLRWYLARLNRRLDEEQELDDHDHDMTRQGLTGKTGRRVNSFRYML